MAHQAHAKAPAAIALRQALIDAVDAARFHGGHGGRPHRLDHHLTGGHQVDAFVEGGPEGAELAVLLQRDQGVDRLVDLFLGHVALVAIGHVAARLKRHGGVHDADGGDVDQRRLALEFRVEQLCPAGDLAPRQVGADAQRVGVVDRRHDRGEVGGPGREGRRLRAVGIQHLEGQGPLTAQVGAVEILAVAHQRRHLAPKLDLADVHRLKVARAIDLLKAPELEIRDVHGFGLVHHLGHQLRRLRRLRDDLEAEIGAGLFADVGDHRIGRADLGQRHVLDVLRPDHRRPEDAGPDARARHGGGALQELPACHTGACLGRRSWSCHFRLPVDRRKRSCWYRCAFFSGRFRMESSTRSLSQSVLRMQ